MESKSALRRRMAAVRDALAPDQRLAKSEAIARRLAAWDLFIQARTVFVFLSTRSEVQTAPIIATALAQAKVIGAPRTLLTERRLEFAQVRDLAAELVAGPYGIAEPGPQALRLQAAGADLILVPGLAFDPRGYRVGYGGGFYDRLLAGAAQAVAVGVAFDEQVIERVPEAEHDRPVDWIATDQRLTACRGT